MSYKQENDKAREKKNPTVFTKANHEHGDSESLRKSPQKSPQKFPQKLPV